MGEQGGVTAQDVIASVPEGICTVDAQGGITLMNPAAERMLGWAEAEVLGRQLRDVVRHASHRGLELGLAGDDPFSSVPQAGETFRTEDDVFTRKDGTSFPVAYTWAPLITGGSVVGAVITFQDIAERKEVEKALKHQALHDALTDLPNRTLFQDRLEQAMHTAHRNDSTVALLLMDLRRFKEVNDTFGHRYGDLLLEQLARALRRALRETDTIARLGGDEFAVILPEADEQGGKRTAAKLLEIVRRPFRIEGKTLYIGASLGIALYPQHGNDLSVLLHRADMAMYVARHTHTDFAVYRSDHIKRPGKTALIGEL
jgi:diguanylate cyclase (GGDEF)-like protein/PAS domain S-box-containing protein